MPKHWNTVTSSVTTRLLIAAVALLPLIVWGCKAEILAPLPLDITVSADKLTAARADSITFEFRAQGGVLRSLEIGWGDGTSHTAPLSGARTAEATIRHAYQQSGVYQVAGAVEDAAGSRRTATLSVTIQ